MFVRTVGCPLACRFCDTPYAATGSPEGLDLTVEEILGRILLFNCRHVVLTGGEPMLRPEIVRLSEAIGNRGKTITVETAGTFDRPVVCDLLSISPKLSNSTPSADTAEHVRKRHERLRRQPETIRKLIDRYDYQFKFVVDHPDDFPEIESYLRTLPEIPFERVYLMPQGTVPEELDAKEPWIRAYCDRYGMNFAPRMQIFWYGDTRRT